MALLLAAILPSRVRGQVADADSTSVAIAVSIGANFDNLLTQMQQNGVAFDRAKVVEILSAKLLGQDVPMTVGVADAYMMRLLASLRPDAVKLDPAEQQAFVDRAAAGDCAVVTASGLVFEVLEEGRGDCPTADDTVVVSYRGLMSDGEVFDETETPLTFEVGTLTPGFSEGLQLMRPGGSYRLVMPASLAYGEEGIPGVIPGNAALQFDVKLVEVKKNVQ